MLYKIHGDASGKNVVNILFETGNGSVGLLVSTIQTFLIISVDTTKITSSLSTGPIQYVKLYGDDITIDSIDAILQDGESDKYRAKIKVPSGRSLGVFDVVAIAAQINALSVGVTSES